MKVAIIGSRGFDDYNLVIKTLAGLNISLIISGGANGADLLGEKYADEYSIPKQIFLPDWENNGKSAGFIRNTDIVENAELVIAFWDGVSSGTKDSIDKAKKFNKKLLIIDFN